MFRREGLVRPPHRIGAAPVQSVADPQICALLVIADALFSLEHDQVAALAARYAVPVMYPSREPVDAGGLTQLG
jgi:hypothetical protein